MRTHHGMLKQIAKLGFILMMGVSMNADAGLFEFGGTRWKEEVLLNDGKKIVVSRPQSHGGWHEIVQEPAIKESTLTMPDTNQRVTWKDEYNEDVDGASFNLLRLDIVKDTTYLVVSPTGCLPYKKWDRPNPPYVILKYQGKEWQRISLQELPAEFITLNLIINTFTYEEKFASQGLMTTEMAKQQNARYQQPEFKTILWESVKRGTVGSSVNYNADNGIDTIYDNKGDDAPITAMTSTIGSITWLVTWTSTTIDHSLYGTNTIERINGLGGNDTHYRDAANDECIAHHRQCERWVA